jgi:hypothetical protein
MIMLEKENEQEHRIEEDCEQACDARVHQQLNRRAGMFNERVSRCDAPDKHRDTGVSECAGCQNAPAGNERADRTNDKQEQSRDRCGIVQRCPWLLRTSPDVGLR